MNGIIDIIKQAQDENKFELAGFEVEAWGTENNPFLINHKSFTLSDVDWIAKQCKGSKAKELALTVIRKALDVDGNKMFTLKDLNFLINGVKSDVIVEIVNNLNREDSEVDHAEE